MLPASNEPVVEPVAATAFSFLRAASHPEEMVAQAVALGLAALGIADRNTVAGVVRAHEAAKQNGPAAAGRQPAGVRATARRIWSPTPQIAPPGAASRAC